MAEKIGNPFPEEDFFAREGRILTEYLFEIKARSAALIAENVQLIEMRRNAVHLLNLVRNNDTDGCYKGDGEATNGNKACNGDGAANGGGDISARGGANDGAQNGKKTDNVVNPMMAMDTADNLDKQHTNEK